MTAQDLSQVQIASLSLLILIEVEQDSVAEVSGI